MVIVEIHHQHPAARRRLVSPRGDRDVVEEAEAHPAVRLGMVAGWADERENRPAPCDAASIATIAPPAARRAAATNARR